MDNKILADRLKNLRKSSGVTQKYLAKVLNVAPSVIAGAETKRGISKSLASKLAEYFKTDIGYWLNENAEKEFFKDIKLFETTKTVVSRLIDEKLLTLSNIDSMDDDVKDIIFQSIKFDIKVALKKKEQD